MDTAEKNSTAAFCERLRALEGRPLAALESPDATARDQSGPATGSTAAFVGRLRAYAGRPLASLTVLED